MSKKTKRNIELFIVDIYVAIRKIETYVSSFKETEEFRHNSIHWDATIRQLEVIGEALNCLLDDPYFEALSPRYFRKIVNFRNVIAHGYFGIDAEEVWEVVQHKLDPLFKDLVTIVETSHIDLSYAFKTTIDEYTMLKDKDIVDYISKLSY